MWLKIFVIFSPYLLIWCPLSSFHLSSCLCVFIYNLLVDFREIHHFCLLLGYGADAICPYLVFEVVQILRQEGIMCLLNISQVIYTSKSPVLCQVSCYSWIIWVSATWYVSTAILSRHYKPAYDWSVSTFKYTIMNLTKAEIT
jgi:hypothetical protein